MWGKPIVLIKRSSSAFFDYNLTDVVRGEKRIWRGVVGFDEDQADDWMMIVKLIAAEARSSLDLSLTLSLIRWSTRSWNWSLFVVQLNNFGETRRRGGETFKVRITEEWSEFRSRMLAVLLWILFGIFATKISKISGFLRTEVGQYVGPGGARTLKFFCDTKLWRTEPRGLLARQP